MKQFKFKLETLHNVRKQEEEDAHRAFMAASEQLDVILQKISLLEQERKETLEELQQKKNKGVNLESYCHYHHYLDKLTNDILLQQDEAMRAQNIVAEKRIQFMNVRKKVKVLDNLKEKQYDRWDQQLKKAEARTLDEIATIRHSKLQREGKTDAE